MGTVRRTACDVAASQVDHARIELKSMLDAAPGMETYDRPTVAGINAAIARLDVAMESLRKVETVYRACTVVLLTADDADRHGWDRPSSIGAMADAVGELAAAMGVDRDYGPTVSP